MDSSTAVCRTGSSNVVVTPDIYPFLVTRPLVPLTLPGHLCRLLSSLGVRLVDDLLVYETHCRRLIPRRSGLHSDTSDLHPDSVSVVSVFHHLGTDEDDVDGTFSFTLFDYTLGFYDKRVLTTSKGTSFPTLHTAYGTGKRKLNIRHDPIHNGILRDLIITTSLGR